jgi:uncharacterized caspase-like protein
MAFAAKEGTTADDGSTGNSPFTAALLAHLEEPGLEVQFLFRKVRDRVLEATQGRQEPFTYGSCRGWRSISGRRNYPARQQRLPHCRSRVPRWAGRCGRSPRR